AAARRLQRLQDRFLAAEDLDQDLSTQLIDLGEAFSPRQCAAVEVAVLRPLLQKEPAEGLGRYEEELATEQTLSGGPVKKRVAEGVVRGARGGGMGLAPDRLY